MPDCADRFALCLLQRISKLSERADQVVVHLVLTIRQFGALSHDWIDRVKTARVYLETKCSPAGLRPMMIFLYTKSIWYHDCNLQTLANPHEVAARDTGASLRRKLSPPLPLASAVMDQSYNPSLLLAICGIAGVFLLGTVVTRRKPYPNGPVPIPFLGNVGTLRKMSANLDPQLHQLKKDWGSLCMLWYGRSPVIIINSPRAARELLNEVCPFISPLPLGTQYQTHRLRRDLSLSLSLSLKLRRVLIPAS